MATMIFGTRKYNDISLRMQNTPLTRQYQTKILGIILSTNLKWQKHIDVVLNKTSKSIGIISKVRHLLPPYLTRMLYMTLVEPYLNYCNLIWASGKKTELLERVLNLHKKFCRLVTFSHFSAHSAPLFSQLNILNIYNIYKCNLATYIQILLLIYKCNLATYIQILLLIYKCNLATYMFKIQDTQPQERRLPGL